jgi:hypothetical protein
MKQIYKYKVMGAIEMPKGAEILKLMVQDSFNVCIWAKVDPEMEIESRRFEVIGTGHPFNDTNKQYIGTYQDGPFVWHIFEIK